MVVLGALLWIFLILWFLTTREKSRQKKIAESKEEERIWKEFRSKIFKYAIAKQKIRKLYIVDSEVEGGEWSYFYDRKDQMEIEKIINKSEKYLISKTDSIFSLNKSIKKSILTQIDLLPIKEDGYITS